MSGRRRVVVAAIIERGGRVLVSQRSADSGHGGRWEFPGGKREHGEADEQALARELREELGVAVAIGERIWEGSAGPLRLRFHRCRWLPGQRPRALGSDQFRWVRREDLPGYDFLPADAEMVSRLARGEFGDRNGSPGVRAPIESLAGPTEVAMAKAKRARRTSIRTMDSTGALDALEEMERAERLEAERLARAAAVEDGAEDGEEDDAAEK